MDKPILTPPELGRMLQARRTDQAISLQQAAVRIGVSAATLSRLERLGRDEPVVIPDSRTLELVAQWLEVTVAQSRQEVTTPPDIPEVVDVYLRADKNLSLSEAQALSDLFKKAYSIYASKPPKASSNE